MLHTEKYSTTTKNVCACLCAQSNARQMKQIRELEKGSRQVPGLKNQVKQNGPMSRALNRCNICFSLVNILTLTTRVTARPSRNSHLHLIN